MTRATVTLAALLLAAAAAPAQVHRVRRAANQLPVELLRGRFGRGGAGNLVRGPIARVHEPFREPMTAEKIRAAIDDAVMYLRARQAANGCIATGHNRDGETALAALAMLAAGAHPATDTPLQRALAYLANVTQDNTYVRAIRANVWEYALRKVPYDKEIRAALEADYKWLLAALGKKRAWRYRMASTDWDNSCSQYGVLGIWAAARAGFQPGDEFWLTCSRHFRQTQRPDGGWSYQMGGSTPNMATAGLASMFLVFDMYHGKSYYSAANPRTFTAGAAAAVLQSIQRGMTWLGKAQANKDDGYYLYGIERTGVASGRKYIGGEDWFRRGARTVLRAQRADGSIPLGRWGGAITNTCFCTLFLVYGGAPVAFNKLECGGGQDWNLNPRDLANLTKHLWSAYERPLNWHSVSISAPVEEFEAPILFISGSQAARFGEGEFLKLRRYALRGGTIFAEPSDHSETFALSMGELARQMFPKNAYPTYELRPLGPDHGVYTVLKQTWKKRPRLRGISDGSRTFFFLSEEYLSADWQMNRTDSDAFKLAMNLLFYATDLGTLAGKFASILPATPAAKPRKDPAVVARARYAGADDRPRDWDAAATCWQQFAPYVKHVTGCEMKEADPVALGRGDLKGVHVLHVTGQGPLRLTGDERAALKRFAAGGGMILVDAYAGSRAFAESARRQLEAVFGKLAPLADDSLLAEGRFLGGVDLTRGVRFKLPARRLLRKRGQAARGQKLLVARVRNRPAVIFSEFDLCSAMAGIESYRSLGYKPASARKIVGNLLAYATAD